MKWILPAIIAALLCMGCATFEETHYLDREFGQAQLESWNKMIAYPDKAQVNQRPEGLEGIHAEPTMDVYHRSFSKEPTKGEVIQLGIVGE